MLIKCRKFGVLSFSLILLLACAAVSLAAVSEETDVNEGLPELPLILQGGVEVDGEPVEAGSEILAYYDGELIAKSTVEEEGKYSLNLKLASENYGNIGEVEFYVNGDKTNFEFSASELEAIEDKAPGSIIKADLKTSVSSAIGGSGGSSGTEGGASIASTEEMKSEASVESEGSEESGLSGGMEETTDITQEPASEEGDGGYGNTESAGNQPVFKVLLFIASLLSAFMFLKR